MRFLVDAQLPPGLAIRLNRVGHEAAHVFDIGLLTANDHDIWKHAESTNAVIVTKDEDFVTIRALNSQGPAIVWVRIGNVRNRELMDRFFAALPTTLAAIVRGETVIELS